MINRELYNFKKGDKIICNNNRPGYITIHVGGEYTFNEYYVHDKQYLSIEGVPWVHFEADMFISLKEHRKNKLQKIENLK